MEALTSSSDNTDANTNGQVAARPDDKVDVVIVSANGRGHWLATELAGRGWKTTLIDASENLGPWAPEDSEGPFGFFETSDVTSTQKSWIEKDAEPIALENGFTLWLKDGPFECNGQITPHQIKRRELDSGVESYLRSPGLPGRESEKKRSWLLTQPFRTTWLAHLAHQLTSITSNENHRALTSGVPAPVFASFTVRHVSQEGHRRSLDAVEASGANVVRGARITEVRLSDKKEIDSLAFEVGVRASKEKSKARKSLDSETGETRTENARWFVWLLSPHETQSFPVEVYTRLFPNGSPDFEWFWARFEVELGGETFLDQVPPHAVLIEDIYLPWTHANCMVLRRKSESSAFDVWVRVPARVRGDRDYLTGVGVEIERVLGQRLPQSGPRVSRLPLDIENDAAAALAPKFPVYAPSALAKHSAMKASNLFFCGSETWSSLDWLGTFRRQNEVLIQVEKLRAQYLAAEEKRARQEAKKAAQKAAKEAAKEAALKKSIERPGPQP